MDSKESGGKPTNMKQVPLVGFGMTMGTGVGIAFGAAFHRVGVGVVFGAGFGLVLGALLDTVRRKSQ
jgi:hypothetical protein